MKEIVLKSGILEVTKINRRTKAKMFENLKVGDQIKLSIEVVSAGKGRSGTYASYIEAVNIKTNEKTYSSFNQIPVPLRAFEFKEV